MNQLPPILLAFPGLLLASCGDGTLGYVFDASLAGEFRLDEGTHTVAVRVPTGSVSIISGEAGRVKIKDGRSRLAADRAEDLQVLRQLDFTLHPKTNHEPGVMELGTASLPVSLNPSKTAMIMRVLLEVPHDISVDIQTGRGPVSVVDRRADITVHTGAGDLNFRRNQGNLVGFSGTGDCLVDSHRGGLDLQTMEGAVIAYVDELGKKGVQLRTHAGSIQCKLPVGAAFDLDMLTEIGAGISGYDLPVETLERGVQIRGMVLGGGPEVRLWTARGDLSIYSKH